MGADGRVPRVPLDAALLRAAPPEEERRHERQVVAGGEPALGRVGHPHDQDAVAELAGQLVEGGPERLAGPAAGRLEDDQGGTTRRQDPVEDRGAGPDGSIERGPHAHLRRERTLPRSPIYAPRPGEARENASAARPARNHPNRPSPEKVAGPDARGTGDRGGPGLARIVQKRRPAPPVTSWRDLSNGQQEHDRGGRERSGGLGRPPGERGDRDLPDHPLLEHGRVRRRVVGQRPQEHLGHRARRRRDAVRGRRRRGRPRGAAGGGAHHDLHGVAGPPPDDPQHVQDRRAS